MNQNSNSIKTIIIVVLVLIAGYFIYQNYANRQASQQGLITTQSGPAIGAKKCGGLFVQSGDVWFNTASSNIDITAGMACYSQDTDCHNNAAGTIVANADGSMTCKTPVAGTANSFINSGTLTKIKTGLNTYSYTYTVTSR